MLPLSEGCGSEPVDPILVVSAPSRERLSEERGLLDPEAPAEEGTVNGMVFMLQGKITIDEWVKLGPVGVFSGDFSPPLEEVDATRCRSEFIVPMNLEGIKLAIFTGTMLVTYK